MTLDETIDLLTVAAAFDRRAIGEADAIAWHAAIGDLGFEDCRTAIVGHYQDSREWIMPADVRMRVRAMRRARLDRGITPAPAAGLTDEPARYRAELAAGITRIADGRRVPPPIAAPVREDAPPAEFTEARAKLTPDKQELARLQAAEARAERERLQAAGQDGGAA